MILLSSNYNSSTFNYPDVNVDVPILTFPNPDVILPESNIPVAIISL